jgi:hypothetical protein
VPKAGLMRNVAPPWDADLQKGDHRPAVPSIRRNRSGGFLFDVLPVDLPLGTAVGGPRQCYQHYRNGDRSYFQLGDGSARWPLSREVDKSKDDPNIILLALTEGRDAEHGRH